jgi:N-methylhydantoinase B
LVEFLEDSELTDLTDLSRTLQQRAESAMRRAIEAVPDGTYHATLDADGFDADETHIACTITINGSDLHIDYSGTSPQINRGLNTVMNYTYAYSAYPIKCALDPNTPRNEGSYRPVTVAAPQGCILNPYYPAPCNARQLTGHLLAGVIYRALAEAIPDRVIADSGSAPSMRAVFNGLDPRGNRFSQILFASGGMGASMHHDGLPTTAFPTNAGAGSIEAFESVSPLIVWKKEFRLDSGGAGRYRGGLGQECEIEVRSSEPLQLSLLSDRWRHPALGVLGGKPGATSTIRFSDGTVPHQKSRTTIEPGMRLHMHYAGGGGYGDPKTRDPERVRDDIKNGYISQQAAQRNYGIS